MLDSNTLLGYQPDYYKTSKVMQQINNANANELNILNSRIDLIKLNYDIDTADANTLTRWEKEFKIKSLPNDSLDARRARVKSRFLGQGDFSEQMIKDIAKAYISEEIDVILDLSNFEFKIEFISNSGISKNIEDFFEVIEEVKTAYLRADYKMTSNTNSILAIKAFGLYGEEIRVLPYQITSISTNGNIDIGLAQTSGAETITVQPKEG